MSKKTKYEVVLICDPNCVNEYPDNRNQEYPDLVGAHEDEYEIFIVNTETGSCWEAREFFFMAGEPATINEFWG